MNKELIKVLLELHDTLSNVLRRLDQLINSLAEEEKATISRGAISELRGSLEESKENIVYDIKIKPFEGLY